MSETRHISYPEIAELKTPMNKILTMLGPSIEDKSYGLIISDDTSGRVPAVALHSAISTIYLAKEVSPIPFIGIQGSDEDEHIAHLQKAFEKRKKRFNLESNQKALLVTESVLTGDHIIAFRCALAPVGIIFDVATVRAQHKEDWYREESVIGAEQKFYSGGGNGQKMSDNHGLSGLNHHKYTKEPFLGIREGKIIDKRVRKVARRALIDARTLGINLANEYLDIE